VNAGPLTELDNGNAITEGHNNLAEGEFARPSYSPDDNVTLISDFVLTRKEFVNFDKRDLRLRYYNSIKELTS
jgi:hypothetical protein